MKGGKAVDPDRIPMEAWKNFGKMTVAWLTRLLNKINEGRAMAEKWRNGVLVPI